MKKPENDILILIFLLLLIFNLISSVEFDNEQPLPFDMEYLYKDE